MKLVTVKPCSDDERLKLPTTITARDIAVVAALLGFAIVAPVVALLIAFSLAQ